MSERIHVHWTCLCHFFIRWDLSSTIPCNVHEVKSKIIILNSKSLNDRHMIATRWQSLGELPFSLPGSSSLHRSSSTVWKRWWIWWEGWLWWTYWYLWSGINWIGYDAQGDQNGDQPQDLPRLLLEGPVQEGGLIQEGHHSLQNISHTIVITTSSKSSLSSK